MNTRATRMRIAALLFPILALMALTAYKHHLLAGEEVILPIGGYDPRDLLSGHYLIYRVNYGMDGVCDDSLDGRHPGYVCLEPKGFFVTPPDSCETVIRGTCEHSRFEAGIERFYIPEGEANKIGRLIWANEASIVLSVNRDGTARIKDLLIDGMPWDQAVEPSRARD